ncbi:endo-beta-N-acetylglucosaminidase H [Chryseobacterium daecheongense]|uniref:Secreted protein (Por secretion system target) n=1 Tax=Chryseobacterium daecheongense TaxID=192389 RepID=A0A3N0VSS8_9FLAO|nr:endo-beta-N-acetylglucosaminidase H [Chryseobacterium daecheongense]ROH95863.1 T9SS C-terminal target domain-containing protein [Chryseobacterium daecheongense]TDX91742.1 putative secreted protein (Por secretion system target) [Chryseobacterium daecheongense]
MKQKSFLIVLLILIFQAKTLINAQPLNPLGICYVEVNNNNMLNAGSYTLQTSNKQLFNVAIIFAANINYDVSKSRAYISNNNNVSKVLNDVNTYVKPLQQKGIKVLLDILGNHQGAGICNFPTREAARDFALQIAHTVYTYGLDGVDLDDEYADYGNNGTGQPNNSSFVMLLQELKAAMPDKLITFYYLGPATTRQSYNGDAAGNYIDYSWNAYYGTYNAPSVPPLTNTKLSAAATWINNTSASTLSNLATNTINDGYGVFMWYDLKGINSASYLSTGSNILYGENTVLSGPLYSWTAGTTCDPPLGLEATNMTGISAKLNWTSNGTQTYNIDYKPANSTTWTNVASNYSGNNITVNNLTANTNYDWRIQTNCSPTLKSTYIFAPRFNSGNGCAIPTGLTSGSFLGTTTQLSWDAGTASSYTLQYKTAAAATWTEIQNITTNTYTLQNLTQNTNYVWKIQAVCGSTTSAYSSEASFNSGFTPVQSPGARSLIFNGSTTYLNAGQFNLSGNAITFEGWVKVNAFKSAFPYISSVVGVEVGDNNSAMLRFGDGNLANNKLQFILSFGSSQVKLNSNTGLNTNTWYHVAATYDGASMKIYVNGNLDASSNVTGNFTANGILYLARNYDNSRTLNGFLDEFRVWKKALTPQEISNNNCNVSPYSTGLEANWKMNEGSGNGALDTTSNTHFATLVNMSDSNWSTDVACTTSLSTENSILKDENSIYPNPVKKGEDIHFTIKDNSINEVSLYDISGKLVKKQTIDKNNATVSTQSLSSGTYIYTITSTKKQTASSGKVIVK